MEFEDGRFPWQLHAILPLGESAGAGPVTRGGTRERCVPQPAGDQETTRIAMTTSALKSMGRHGSTVSGRRWAVRNGAWPWTHLRPGGVMAGATWTNESSGGPTNDTD